MFPPRSPFFEDPLVARAALIAASAEDDTRGNLPVSPYAPGSITTLALVLLFWPLLSKLIGLLRRPKKVDPVLAEQPVD
jgi:hypothetical protein